MHNGAYINFEITDLRAGTEVVDEEITGALEVFHVVRLIHFFPTASTSSSAMLV